MQHTVAILCYPNWMCKIWPTNSVVINTIIDNTNIVNVVRSTLIISMTCACRWLLWCRISRRLAIIGVLFLQLKVWVLSLGFTLAFGALFAKTWRVHQIMCNTKMTKLVRTHYIIYISLSSSFSLYQGWGAACNFFTASSAILLHPLTEIYFPHAVLHIMTSVVQLCRQNITIITLSIKKSDFMNRLWRGR